MEECDKPWVKERFAYEESGSVTEARLRERYYFVEDVGNLSSG